jgi:aryl-alcohol dehydrogenase-like predicted oxidoreductase
VDVCLCGPKDICQLREALATLDLGPLATEDLARMKRIGDHVHRTTRRF